MKRELLISLAVALLFFALAGSAAGYYNPGSPYKWPKGPNSNPAHFRIGVWLQSPSNAVKYKAAGINMYVGLWEGPTEEQLATLKDAGMQVICEQNAVGLAHVDDPLIIGWAHQDEPDNAQPDGSGGYGSPVLPSVIVEEYQRMKANDYTRPVFLNLGQGVANTDYIGRGSRTGHTEDYPEYIEGADIVSFDIYPMASAREEVKGKLWMVADGVKNLVEWSGDNKPVWNFIECTHVSSTEKATPAQVKAEVWSSIINGSTGIVYFAHEFQPEFNEDALLDDSEMLEAVTAINAQITEFAPLLNSDSEVLSLMFYPDHETVAVDIMVKRDPREDHLGDIYVFAANKYDSNETLKLIERRKSRHSVDWEVVGEDRIAGSGIGFTDEFGPYEVHIYKVDMSNVSVQEETPEFGMELYGNYPNPFNPNTTITFDLSGFGHTSLTVYNIQGQKIKELVSEKLTSGKHEIVWNGRDNSGVQVASGVYITQLRQGQRVAFGRMVMMK